MKSIKLLFLLVFVLHGECTIAQQQAIKATPEQWNVLNRNVSYSDGVIHLDAQEKDGVLWVNNENFKNGVIELDIKGKDLQGESFVGVAFHGQDNKTFEGVYFRPFNFKSADRNSHSVQYISVPDNDWSFLRNKYPGKYEHTILPVPDPDDWFHAKIVMDYPTIKVYVNNNVQSTLEVHQISAREVGNIGVWVGNGSEGWFKNFTITRTN